MENFKTYKEDALKHQIFFVTNYRQYICNDGSKENKGLGNCSWPGKIVILLYYLPIYYLTIDR